MEQDAQAESSIASRRVFDGKIMRVRVDTVKLPNGVQASREVVEHRPAVVLVPIDKSENVILVRQYRHAVGETLLEAPAGVVEEGETPSECGQRELQEETGYRARSLVSLGSFWTTPGFCDEFMFAFVARDLVPSALEPDPDEEISTERLPLSRVSGLIRSGEIRDAKTIAALLMVTCADSA